MIREVSRETFVWTKQVTHLDPPDPVRIRLGIHADTAAVLTPDAHYLVVTGFFRLLRDLNVMRFTHAVSEDGLTFFLEVRESRSVVRSYLMNLKNYHVLGAAWDFVLLDGVHLTAVSGESRHALLNAFDLYEMAHAHLVMGSRPLRFSRYFLYAALRPFARVRGYGSTLMCREDAKGEVSFYHILRGLELIQRSFQSVDCSGIASLQEINTIARPLMRALEEIGAQHGFLGDLFYQTLFLATVYEQKTPVEQIPERVVKLTTGWEKEWKSSFTPETERLASALGMSGMRGMLQKGFEPLLDVMDDAPLDDLDDLSLLLLSRFTDTHLLQDMNPIQLIQVQKLAHLALQGEGVDRDQFNDLFDHNHLVADGVRDLIVLVQLLAFLEGEI